MALAALAERNRKLPHASHNGLREHHDNDAVFALEYIDEEPDCFGEKWALRRIVGGSPATDNQITNRFSKRMFPWSIPQRSMDPETGKPKYSASLLAHHVCHVAQAFQSRTM